MLTSYIYTAYKNVSFWTLNAVKSLKSVLLTETSIHQPAYQKAHKPRPHRHSERGNVFFTLFGAVAVVGVLGAGIMATMRGPLSTMVEVNLRERAKTEMSIAAKLIMLESTDSGLPNSGDCDLDGFIEPLEYAASIPSLTGGGTFPASISTRQDPWGQDYGYCVWDAGNTVDDAGCGGGTQTRLAGDGSTSEGYPIIVIVSAGPDGTFETSCGDLSGTQLNKAGDDLVQEYTYEYAVSATGGLWKIKSGTPTTATIDKDLEVTGGASFSNNVAMGATAQLQLGAASLLLPDQNAVGVCDNANDQILRRNTGSGDSIIQICDFTGTTNDWVTVGSIGAIWTRGTGDDVYYNDGTPQVGIGTTSPDDTLDIVGTLDVSSTAAIGGLLTAEAGLTSSAGTTTLGTTNISGATAISNTLAVTNDVTITGSSNTGSGDSLRVNNSDSSRIFVVQHDGRVGIGDADPAEELDVAGDIVIEGAYMIDSYNVLASPNTTADTNIFVGNNAGNMGLTATVDGNTVVGAGAATGIDGANNTILGQGAGTTLTTGTNNILIGQGVDVPLNTTSDYLNIGGAITGSLTTNSIAIGGDLTISGDDLFMGTNTDGAILVADGSNFNPVVASGDATIANDGAITIADGAVDEGKLDMSNSATGGDCLKFISGALTWQACSGGGGGDGVGTDGFTDLADTPNAYAGAAADANKLVVVNATGDGLEFVDAATAAGEKDRIKDLTSPTDTYIDVDTTDDGLTNSTIFVNNGVTSMTISSAGAISMAGTLAVTDDAAFDTNTLYVDASANNVGFGTTTPNASALIDMTTTSRGFLAPRMTEAERDLIASPATGLLVFATDGGDAGIFQFYDGTNWIDVGAGGAEGGGLWTDLGGDRIHYGTTGTEQVGIGTNNPLATLDVNGGIRVGSVAGAAPSYMVLNSLANVDTTPANGECLAYNSVSTNWESAACGGAGTIADDGLDWDKFSDTMVLDTTTTIDMTAGDLNFDGGTLFIDSSANNIGIGTATPNANAALDVNGTNMGLLPPRNADPGANITGVAGLMAYDSADNELQYYNGTSWVSLSADSDTLGDLSCAAGQIIRWNGTAWECTAQTLSDGSINLQFTSSAVTSGSWGQAGNQFTLVSSNVYRQDIAALSATRIAYINLTIGEEALTTYDFDGTDWIQVGNSFAVPGVGSGRGTITKLSANSVVIYESGGLQAYQFNGTDWTTLGNKLVLQGEITALDNNTIAFASGSDLEVYDFDGTNWAKSGSTTTVPYAIGTYGDIETIDSNTIAVSSGGGILAVYDWNGTNFVLVGNPVTYGGPSTRGDIAVLNPNLIAVIDAVYEGNSSLRTYSWDGTDFTLVGTPLAGVGSNGPNLTAMSGTRVAFYDNGIDRLRAYDFSATANAGTIADVGTTGILDSLLNVGDRFRVYRTVKNNRIFTVGGITDANTIEVLEAPLTEGPVLGDIEVLDGSDDLLDDLADVNVAGVSDGECLKYDTAAGEWVADICADASSIADDALDWDKFTDTMVLDATTTIDMTAGDLNFDGGTLFIDSSANNIGIGTATPNANAALDVNGTNLGFLPPRNTDPNANITGTAGLIAYDSTDNQLQYYNGTAWVALTAAAAPDRIQDSDNNSYVDIDTANDNTLRVQIAGAPSTYESLVFFKTGASNHGTALDLFNSSSGGVNRIAYKATGGTTYGEVGYNGANMYLSNATNTDILFMQGSVTTFEKMRVSTGGVGIGTSAAPDASAQLEVKSTSRGFLPPRMADPNAAIASEVAGLIAYNSTSNALQYYNGTSWISLTGGGTPAGSNTQIQFNNSGAFGASSNLTWNGTTLAITGDMTFSGIVRDVSDRRLKTDITPLNASDIMTRLTQIDTYTFRMKADPAGRIEYGVMAQELEELFPELVITADDEMGTKSVNYMGLIAPMIEATKSLQNENEELKAQIDDIKTSQADMLEKVNALSVHTGYSVEKAAYDNWLMLAMMAMMGGVIGLLIRRKHA